MNKNNKIGIIGLGYVGLPLARLLATKYGVIGYDIDSKRIDELKKGVDTTLEVDAEVLKPVIVSDISGGTGLQFTNYLRDLEKCNVYIVTVPTPVNKKNKPNLDPLVHASKEVGSILKKDDLVIYESTVFPGATEEICVPLLEENSGLNYNVDFYVGYSPERINPGDKKHTVEKILKVTSGSTPDIAVKVDKLYKSVIQAGTHMAPSIKVAEAAKVIENSQRDINIAFVNELAKIFNLLNIDTQEVLKAAGTKWNFLPFKPGLVGGHCIGVDPYYLAQKAQEVGYTPEIILAGRRMNDSMGKYVAAEVVKLFVNHDKQIKNADILVMGITFKENCPDVRNTKVVDVINELKEFGTNVTVFDPWANSEEVHKTYAIHTYDKLPDKKFDGVVLAVAHNEFKNLSIENCLKENGILYDVKGVLDIEVNGSL